MSLQAHLAGRRPEGEISQKTCHNSMNIFCFRELKRGMIEVAGRSAKVLRNIMLYSTLFLFFVFPLFLEVFNDRIFSVCY